MAERVDEIMSMNSRLRIGLLINPYAGVGGPMALKGSDGIDVDNVLARGGQCLAAQRAAVALSGLQSYQSDICWLTAPSIMGEQTLAACGFSAQVVGDLPAEHTAAEDTERLALDIVEQNVDILLFVGGDGTARNIVNALKANHSQQLVLGIPAGVKMHSGVYTVSPQAATRVLALLIQKEPVSATYQEVRDIDEEGLREGRLNSHYYGELWVPNDQRYVQEVKNTARQSEDAEQLDIAASIVDEMEDDSLYLIGCGTTPNAIMETLGLPSTLLGIDVVLGREVIAMDVTAVDLEALLEKHYPYHTVVLLITAIGGQGHIIGRGNQQLSPKVLRRVGKQQTQVLMTPSKIAELVQRPLRMDSGDPELDQEWTGLITVYTGYQQTVVYALNSGE
jgi:predicted polyphosphate/ATP-dependent NAD kinase